MLFYKDFSEFSEDEIKLQVFKFITEKSCNNSIADIFLNAVSCTYKTKIIVCYTETNNADTVIGDNFKENIINLCKYKDHYNLIEQIHDDQTQEPTGNITSSINMKTLTNNAKTLESDIDTLTNLLCFYHQCKDQSKRLYKHTSRFSHESGFCHKKKIP